MALRFFTMNLIAAAALAASVPAWPNGDTFFNSTEIPGNPQYVVFGSVKDVQGHYLSHATVTVSVAIVATCEPSRKTVIRSAIANTSVRRCDTKRMAVP